MINFLKKNWLVAILFLVVVYLLSNRRLSLNQSYSGSSLETTGIAMDSSLSYAPKAISSLSSRNSQVAPSDSSDRLVITDTSLSLQVKDVSQSIKQIEAETKNLGGFLVTSHLSKPELAASGNITIRVPTDKLSQALDIFRTLAVKVVSESIVGTDVTDQYQDLDARLQVLYKTKSKFESIMDQATKVPDLLDVQRELVSLQSQIDSIIGQQQYYKKSADLSKVTIYLSTDDLSLPYAPTNQWRPLVVFKTAVRSLLSTSRQIGSLVIWLAVYSPLILIGLFVYKLIKRRLP